MKRKITELIIILFFYIMQVSAARVISIANISPNWLIIMPVFLAFSVVRMMECLQDFLLELCMICSIPVCSDLQHLFLFT